MPSKLQNELNKLRGEVSATGNIYTESIALLRDALNDAEDAIKELQTTDTNYNSKINSISGIAKKALSLSRNSLKKTGDIMSGILESHYFNTAIIKSNNTTGIKIQDENGNDMFWFDYAGLGNQHLYGNLTLDALKTVDGRDLSVDGGVLDSHGASNHTNRTRYIWLGSPHYLTGGRETYGIALDCNTDEQVMYNFIVPEDFVSIGNIYIYYAADSGIGNVVLDITATYGSVDEAQHEHIDNDLGNVIATSNTSRQRFTTSGLFTSLASNDVAFIRIKRDADHASDTNTDDFIINGVLIEYNADM